MGKLNSVIWYNNIELFFFFHIFSHKELRKRTQGGIEGNTVLSKMNNFGMSESSLYLLLN